MKLSDGALAFWQRVLAKLSQRSSVCSYLTLFATFFANQFKGNVALIAQTVSAVATILLFLLNDPQVRYVLTGKLPVAPKTPTVPQPFDSDRPDKG